MAAETWRELLGQRAPTPQERRSLAEKTDIKLRTLERWIAGEIKKPRLEHLQRLLIALPADRERLVLLLQKEFPAFAVSQTESTRLSIPAAFYARVLDANTHVAEPLHFWTLATMILQHMIPVLDPENHGMELVIVECVRPRTGIPVRSLCERISIGTPPWPQVAASRTSFWGSESLVGYAASTATPAVVQKTAIPPVAIPVVWLAQETSAAALPLQRAGRMAGCLLVSSTRPDFFTPGVLALLQSYADLLVLAFAPGAFYDLKDIALHRMPGLAQQQALLDYFPRRVAALIQDTGVSREVAEERVRQEIEDELLQQNGDNGAK